MGKRKDRACHMSELLYLALGLLVGGLAGWYWAHVRARSVLTGRLAEIKQQAVRSAQQVREELDQLHQRIERRDREFEEIQATLEQERQSTATIHARMQHVQDQNKQLERATVELKERVRALSSDLLGFARQSLSDLTRFQDLGKSLHSLLESYLQTIESVESRIRAIPARLKEMGVSPEGEAPRADAPDRAPAGAGASVSHSLSGSDTQGSSRPA